MVAELKGVVRGKQPLRDALGLLVLGAVQQDERLTVALRELDGAASFAALTDEATVNKEVTSSP